MREMERLCEIWPFLADIVIVYRPEGTDDRVEIVTVVEPVEPGVRATLPGLKEASGPTGLVVTLNDTRPEKPVLFNVRMDVADLPAATPTLTGFAETEKSPLTRI